MPSFDVDFLIVGRGLAGTVLGWHLRWAGRTVAVVDRGGPAASRVAAGLLTPVTGQRLARTWRLNELWPTAVRFYRRVEAETGSAIFHEAPAARVFVGPSERELFESREGTLLAGTVGPLSTPLSGGIVAPLGGFEMPAARLDIPRFLDATPTPFDRACTAALDPCDIEVSPAAVRVPKLGLSAGAVVFCTGHADRPNPWFPHVRYNPVKGEILTVRVPGLAERRVLHGGVWLVPLGEGRFRVGATFDRGNTDWSPTKAGRDEVLSRLRTLVPLPVEVVAHDAGVRPVVRAGRPVIGTSPRSARVAVFNGLGSKGSLLAPFFACQLARHLTAGDPLDAEADVRNLPGARL